MTDHLENLIPAITGLAGIILGIVVTTISNWKLRTKETKLRLLEKTFDKIIKSHEDILHLSELLRTTVSTHIVDKDHNVITYPGILHNHEYYDHFLGEFYELTNRTSHWISIELFRELNYIQDYFASLTIQIKGKDDKVLPQIAIIIKQDIIELAGNLERLALSFFENDLPKLKRPIKGGSHKFDRKNTEYRLINCLLGQNISTIQQM